MWYDARMPLDVRPITEAEVPAMQRLVESSFGGDPDPDEMAAWRPLVEPERTHGAFEGTDLVGTGAVFTFDMTVPGGPVPAAGVTAVGVRPTHRRQGVLTAIMAAQLAAIRERGTESFAALWASEAPIYPRFGYGVAARRWNVTVAAHDPVLLGRPPVGRVRLVDTDEIATLAPPLYDAVRATRPGMISRSPARWTTRLTDLPAYRHGGSTRKHAVYEVGGTPRGYAWYRTKSDWTDGRPDGTVHVVEVVALDADAHGGLWRLLLGLDLMARVRWDNLPPDDALFQRLRDPRVVKVNVTDGLHVRVLDVPMALTTRSYAGSGNVVLEVVDETGGWAAGRWALDATPDGATCTATTASADLTLSAEELGAAYLGDTTLRSMSDAGRVDEHVPGAADRASALLAWPRAAWCPEIF
jgi:predicted acetyltransferase